MPQILLHERVNVRGRRARLCLGPGGGGSASIPALPLWVEVLVVLGLTGFKV